MAMTPPPLDGATLSLLWGVPFIGILLSIALAPLIIPRFWHHHYGKVSAFWSLAFLTLAALKLGSGITLHVAFETLAHHFFPFIIFILALYVTTGAVKIRINADPSPLLNTCYLGITSLIASLIGTTGAAMLFLIPFIHLNRTRKKRTHLMIFYIFTVCNIGGGLTPIGDPPLFLGYLEGVHFFWPLKFMAFPVFFLLTTLLGIFYIIDHRAFVAENIQWKPGIHHVRASLNQKKQLFLTGLVVATIASAGVVKDTNEFMIWGVSFTLTSLLRDGMLILLTLTSLYLRPKALEKEQLLNWEPFLEVAKIFVTIFITAAPVLAILKAGPEGDLASLYNFLHHQEGQAVNELYFWMSGFLSAFLDNAPTYLIFFNMAGGHAPTLMGEQVMTLLAFSMGSVFLGALTYIGNAPNFMVKSIAESKEIQMPTFLGYLGWSAPILLPLLYVVERIMF